SRVSPIKDFGVVVGPKVDQSPPDGTPGDSRRAPRCLFRRCSGARSNSLKEPNDVEILTKSFRYLSRR
ncbi:hypothetical protein GW17_00057285, partial [Ensete ventricosum]